MNDNDYIVMPPEKPMGPPPGQGLAIASLVIGIASILFSFTIVFAIVFVISSVVGILLAVTAKQRNNAAGHSGANGLATAGLVLNIIALVLSASIFLICTACVVCARAM